MRVAGVVDRLYKFHEASFETLILQITDLRGRSDTERSTHTPLADNSATLSESYTSEAIETTDNNADENDDNDGDCEVFSEPAFKDEPVFGSSKSNEAQEFEKLIRQITEQRLAEAAAKTEREKLIFCFRESFCQIELRPLITENLAAFNDIEKVDANMILMFNPNMSRLTIHGAPGLGRQSSFASLRHIPSKYSRGP